MTALPPKFTDPVLTAKGERRASVPFSGLRTLWFNTGTQCNLQCAHCYIESSPTNDRLAWMTPEVVDRTLDEAEALGELPDEVGFTGGEPFLNPHLLDLLEHALRRGPSVTVLTNATLPLQRPAVQQRLTHLLTAHGDRLVFRVSLDHADPGPHDAERGAGQHARALVGLRWLLEHGATVRVAGRTRWDEDEPTQRAAYAARFAAEGLALDAHDPSVLLLFPEMDPAADVPEITTSCWGILHKHPDQMMCATGRMVVQRRGAPQPAVLACTLLAYDPHFELGSTLAEARDPVPLVHRHCATFCVLGGASCSA